VTDTICPRCGFHNSFRPSHLPDACECLVCQSQLEWHDIANCGPDCRPLPEETADQETADQEEQESLDA